jgi:F1F0 ATPase subunit 2
MTITIVIGALSGLMLGVLFYGGLWLTIKAAKKKRQPLPLFAASFIVRSMVTISGLFLLARSGPASMLAAVAAMLLIRTLLVRRIRLSRSAEEAGGIWK